MATFLEWLRHDTLGLLLLAAAGIALLLTLIIKSKIEPFIALVATGVLVALVGGVSLTDLVGTPVKASDALIEKGFAGILGHITLIIGLGTVLGAILEHSGGAQVLLDRLIKVFGEKGTPVAMGVTGFLLGIPVFFDIGIFVLAPLVYVAAVRGGRSLALYALPLLAGLSVTHAFLPPHPGPVAAAGFFGVSLGWIIVMGLACGIPAWFASGIMWGRWIGARVHVEVPGEHVRNTKEGSQLQAPGIGSVSLAIGLPMVLILCATFGNVLLPEGWLKDLLIFTGNPAIALTIAVLLAMWILGTRRGMTRAELSKVTGESLRPVGMILLVVGAGAFFGAVLAATGVGQAVAGSLSQAGLPLILSAYVISCGMRIAQGSATVAIVTTSGILAPTMASGDFSQPQLALIVIAISSGSIIASHVNDGGFWIIAKYFNMSVKDTLKTWTVLETVLSVVGFAVAATLFAIVS
ncbi:permease [Arthrobacter sp. MYb211]|uniref:GntP family permease n=1 Tax=unclassified Arthrobacter TaxID=235627 RepID=UPI000CFB3461|nr:MULTISPECIES: gluconate:H+ symporter [unclassified Arthrobacter]PQZ98668.1 permease [Arthrobacter sp. MYb224]PRA03002.1 permease [Arthrobacter sp. MYb229]PRA11035.1 permease [Arthrobacter sp. MYb221]PRB49472.1 permease [Arthrobacter sp. MYb216]PRC07190.1 permease [Arthrobacter sp. MYb211]